MVRLTLQVFPSWAPWVSHKWKPSKWWGRCQLWANRSAKAWLDQSCAWWMKSLPPFMPCYCQRSVLVTEPTCLSPVHPASGEGWCLPYGHLLKEHLSCIIKGLIFQQAVVLVCNSSLPLSGWMGYSSQFQIILSGQRVGLPKCWLSSRREGVCISRGGSLGVIFNRCC